MTEPKKEIEPPTPAGKITVNEGGIINERVDGSITQSGGAGRFGRNRKRRGKGHKQNTNTFVPKSSFKGECKAIEDYFFDCTTLHQSSGHAMTIKHLENHAGSTMEEGGDIWRLIEDLVMTSCPVPTLADGASKQDEKMWDYDYKEYKVRKARL